MKKEKKEKKETLRRNTCSNIIDKFLISLNSLKYEQK